MAMRVRTAVACTVLLSALVAEGLYAAADSRRVAHKAKGVAESPGVKAGMLDGHPYIGNESVAYVWTKPEDGAGLLSIYDRASGKWLLKVDADRARLWRVDVKQGEKKEKRTYENAGRPCTVTTTVEEGEAVASFMWSGDVSVQVVTRLAADETLARSRITVRTQRDDEGLLNVIFPVVHGILPLGKNAADDRVLYAKRAGYTQPSPLVTGEPLNMQYCIEYHMQLAALLGGGRGLYFGDHDPTAAWKDMSWTPNVEAKTLNYAVSHPVLNWGAAEPVTHYESPGDCVIGPFQDLAPKGIMVPMVDTPEEARALVGSMRFPPVGVRRSFGGRRIIDIHGRGYPTMAEATPLLVAQIETPTAVANIEAIAATPGVDVLLFGAADFQIRLGLPMTLPQRPPQVDEAAKTIMDACAANGIFGGIVCGTDAVLKTAADMGYQLISLGGDSGFLLNGAQERLSAARATLGLPSD